GRIDLGGFSDIIDLEPGRQMGQGHSSLKQSTPYPAGLVDEIGPVQVQDVKQVCREWSPSAGDRGIDAAGSPGTGLLKGLWPTVRVERDQLTVDDRTRYGQRPDQLDDLGNTIGDVVQGPGQDADVVALLVDLSADAVQLPL